MEINCTGSTIILLRCIRRSLLVYLVCCPYGLILVTVKEKKKIDRLFFHFQPPVP